MESGDVVMMTSCAVTNTCKKGASDKATITYRANPNAGMVFLFLGSTTADKEHLLREDGTVEALFKDLGYVPDPALIKEG
jgi:hypothetical protein